MDGTPSFFVWTSIKPLVGSLHTVGMFLQHRLWSWRGGLKCVMSETDEGLCLERFRNEGHGPPPYAVALQFFINVGRHENNVKIFPHTQGTDGKFVPVDVGKLIFA
jgi:hypothetical protein